MKVMCTSRNTEPVTCGSLPRRLNDGTPEELHMGLQELIDMAIHIAMYDIFGISES